MAITDKTLIPLGLAVIAIGGGTMWLTNVYAEVKQSTQAILELNIRQDYYNKNLMEINSRLIRIESKIEERKK